MTTAKTAWVHTAAPVISRRRSAFRVAGPAAHLAGVCTRSAHGSPAGCRCPDHRRDCRDRLCRLNGQGPTCPTGGRGGGGAGPRVRGRGGLLAAVELSGPDRGHGRLPVGPLSYPHRPGQPRHPLTELGGLGVLTTDVGDRRRRG